MKKKVSFIDVGRHKHCWTAFCDPAEYGFSWLFKQVSPHLASRDLSFMIDHERSAFRRVLIGYIFAGWQKVGSFEIEREVKE